MFSAKCFHFLKAFGSLITFLENRRVYLSKILPTRRCKPVDAVIVTGLIRPEAIIETLSQDIVPERIFAPRLLRLKSPPTRKVAAQ
jgi:hypothetical protein